MNRNKLYLFLLIACLVGYIWLYYGITTLNSTNALDVCIVKRITTIPCPSCGTTRAVVALSHGDFWKSLYLNPFGIIVSLIMIIAPIWIVLDLLRRKNSFFDFYHFIESIIRKRNIAIFLIILVLLNWIWNIHKHL